MLFGIFTRYGSYNPGFRRWFYSFLLRLCRRRRCSRGRRRCSSLFLAVQRSNLQLALVFLENALVMILPKLFGCIFAADSLKDWGPRQLVLFLRRYWLNNILFCPPSFHLDTASVSRVEMRCLLTWMFRLKFSHIVYIFINNDP